MDTTPRTPNGWRDHVRTAGLAKGITKVALALADHYDGLSPKEGPVEENQSANLGKAMDILEKRGLIEAVAHEGGFKFRLVPPSGDRNEVLRTSSPSLTPDPKDELLTPNPIYSSADEIAPKRKRQHSRRSKSPMKRTGVRRRETVLYRWYDAEDVLLYVGVSANMPGRLEGHEADSTWMDFATRSTVDHYADRDDAEAAEITAIETERPLFNILHNEHPDRVRRIVDYLIDRDRRDLLVPLISRG